ncbi:hypothetical protein SAMN05216481_10429 [Streptomyces radiopugnans]|uniref:Secreted protein n=2 Tax=Streptomyces radiopugnans TaxID=403935 RepID=A0A1H9DCV1_9ACTN|nr:hypothetical protein [Streptomyces radiopugnans]SEQ11296.1 hypothetical protein SAMN05216481_10429 [Streptomyces radiopugnans]
MIRKLRTRMSRGVVLATATAATVTIGATAGGPPNPLPADSQTRPAAGQGKEPQTGPQAAERRQIAASVLGRDLKFTLTAVRSQADPFAASVRLQVFTFEGGAWRESDRALVGEADAWFWFPLTGRHAVCRFSTAGTESAPVAVSLLVTPSIGCSPTENFRIENGRIVPA